MKNEGNTVENQENIEANVADEIGLFEASSSNSSTPPLDNSPSTSTQSSSDIQVLLAIAMNLGTDNDVLRN